MLSYKLCKKLKKVGFPQEKTGSYFCYWGWITLGGGGTKPTRTKNIIHIFEPSNDLPQNFVCKVPTLSELIDACGDKFFDLNKLKNGWGVTNHYYREEGKTPKIAVAELFIKLKEK